MRKKPAFILFNFTHNEGFKMLHRFFVEERGYDLSVLKTLIMRYPYILSKKEQELNHFFKVFGEKGINEEELMQYLLEYPRLISFNIEKQMKEIFYLFNLYHGISEKETMEIFRSFPYLFCVDLDKF